jgi:hypothetical protein
MDLLKVSKQKAVQDLVQAEVRHTGTYDTPTDPGERPKADEAKRDDSPKMAASQSFSRYATLSTGKDG